MNFKQWHEMKNESNREFSNDLTQRYQEKYIQQHPFTNRIYTGMDNFFKNLERMRKQFFF